MPIYQVRHVTTYRYRQPVAFGEHRMMLRPREDRDQRMLQDELRITPEPAGIRWTYDAFGNSAGIARFARRSDELTFDSTIRVEHDPSHTNGFGIEARGLVWPVVFTADEMADLAPYLERNHADPDDRLSNWAQAFLRRGRPAAPLDVLTAIAQAIRNAFTYIRRTESGTQEPHVTLSREAGTCRDFAVLMIEAARAIGLPARFCSGYLYVPSRDRHGVHGGGATHAWAQVYLPGSGWIDFDPTNATVGNAGLIRVAVAREPRQAIPLSGLFLGFASDEVGMSVIVKVTREAADDVGDRTALWA